VKTSYLVVVKKHSGVINNAEFLHQVNDYNLLKEDSVTYILLGSYLKYYITMNQERISARRQGIMLNYSMKHPEANKTNKKREKINLVPEFMGGCRIKVKVKVKFSLCLTKHHAMRTY
jgi:hypothetical protein